MVSVIFGDDVALARQQKLSISHTSPEIKTWNNGKRQVDLLHRYNIYLANFLDLGTDKLYVCGHCFPSRLFLFPPRALKFAG
jgi:hypothetical protein